MDLGVTTAWIPPPVAGGTVAVLPVGMYRPKENQPTTWRATYDTHTGGACVRFRVVAKVPGTGLGKILRRCPARRRPPAGPVGLPCAPLAGPEGANLGLRLPTRPRMPLGGAVLYARTFESLPRVRTAKCTRNAVASILGAPRNS